jgi:hypothetical protein
VIDEARRASFSDGWVNWTPKLAIALEGSPVKFLRGQSRRPIQKFFGAELTYC